MHSIAIKFRCHRLISCARAKVSNCKAIAESKGWLLLFLKASARWACFLKWATPTGLSEAKPDGETSLFFCLLKKGDIIC